jgi:hypothetical protein
MKHPFKISLNRLEKEGTCDIDESVDAEFLHVHERDLDFADPIVVKGSAAAAVKSVLLKLSITTVAKTPCIICGKPVKIEVNLSDVCHAESLDQIRQEVFDYSFVIRDAILTETSEYGECGGKCPEREVLAGYLKKETPLQTPFKGIDEVIGDQFE